MNELCIALNDEFFCAGKTRPGFHINRAADARAC
jgi:hypothetical protein